MEENEIDITSLVEKYEQMRAIGKKIYFDADEFVLLAEYYNSGGSFEEAEQLIHEGLIMHPGSSSLMTMKAKMLIYSAKYEEALEYIRFISDESDIDQSLLKMEALLHLNRFGEAELLADKILKQDLPEEDYYYFISEIAYMLNDVDKYDRAILYLEESMKINDHNPDTIVDLAYAYEMNGNLDKAIEYNNILLDLDPYSFDAWVNIGKLYSMIEQYDKAIDSFDFALTIKEDEVSVLKMKALALYLNENVEESISLFRKCLSFSPDDEVVYDSLLEAYAVMDQFDEMMNLIDQREKQFGSRGIIAKRAYVYISKGDFETAKLLFEEVPEEERETLDYYILEGELAFNEDNMIEAESAFMKAALISEDNEDILDKLANISVAQEKFTQAAEYLEKLLEISPDFPTAKSRLAFIRFEIGSKEPFDEIMEQFSDDELRALLSLILGRNNDDFGNYSRENILTRLNEARENRVLFKNIKY